MILTEIGGSSKKKGAPSFLGQSVDRSNLLHDSTCNDAVPPAPVSSESNSTLTTTAPGESWDSNAAPVSATLVAPSSVDPSIASENTHRHARFTHDAEPVMGGRSHNVARQQPPARDTYQPGSRRPAGLRNRRPSDSRRPFAIANPEESSSKADTFDEHECIGEKHIQFERGSPFASLPSVHHSRYRFDRDNPDLFHDYENSFTGDGEVIESAVARPRRLRSHEEHVGDKTREQSSAAAHRHSVDSVLIGHRKGSDSIRSSVESRQNGPHHQLVRRDHGSHAASVRTSIESKPTPVPRVVPVLNLASITEARDRNRQIDRVRQSGGRLGNFLEKSPRVLETWRDTIVRKGRQSVHLLLEPLRRIEKEEAAAEAIKHWAMQVADRYVAIVGLVHSDILLCQTQLESLQFVIERWITTDHNRQFVLLKGGDTERQRLINRRCLALMDPSLPGSSRPRCFVHTAVPRFESDLVEQLKGTEGENKVPGHPPDPQPDRKQVVVPEDATTLRGYILAVAKQTFLSKGCSWLFHFDFVTYIKSMFWPVVDEVGKIV